MKADVPEVPDLPGVPVNTDGTAQVHNVRFYTIKPRAIVCMAYSNVLKTLALSREDGSIELWDMNHAPFLNRVIQLTRETQAESLAWASKRLFSVDLTGKLIEWDLNSLKPRHEHSPTGNALWCLDVNRAETELAVGSEEGHINIMSIENDEISYKTLFNKHEGRVLCCKFDKPGKRLVTGSVGAVRIWCCIKGHTLHTMTLSGMNTICYALQVLSNNTIIASDSSGHVTVWNGTNATQLEKTKVLDRHLFALAVNEEEDRLICAGMEPTVIRVMCKTQIKRDDSVCERWIKFLQRDAHRHYVKSLIAVDNRIISGGEDGMLCISSLSKSLEKTVKYAPFLQGPCAGLAPSANLLLLRYPQSLHLWRLGTPQTSELESFHRVGQHKDLQLKEMPEKLLQLNVSNAKFIQAAAISPDNAWICYSTDSELRLSRLQQEPLGVERLTEHLPAELMPAHFIVFSQTNKLFLLNSTSRQLRCFELVKDQVEFVYGVDLSAELNAPISHMELTPCGKFMALATSNHTIAIWKLHGKQPKHLVNLPRYKKAGTTALAMHENGALVFAAYADGRLVEYDYQERRFVSETEKHHVSNSHTHCIKGILLDPENPNIVIVYNENFLYVLESYRQDEDAIKSPHNKAKRMSLGSPAVGASSKLKAFRHKMHLNREHLVQVCRLSSKDIVTIGIQTKNLLAALPPPIKRKKFGGR